MQKALSPRERMFGEGQTTPDPSTDCPVCGAPEICEKGEHYFDNFECDRESASQRVECWNCDAQWLDSYEYKGKLVISRGETADDSETVQGGKI